MSDGLARLKGLGMMMSDEIETQNEQLERIDLQVQRADDKVVQQTKRINNMLKKWGSLCVVAPEMGKLFGLVSTEM